MPDDKTDATSGVTHRQLEHTALSLGFSSDPGSEVAWS